MAISPAGLVGGFAELEIRNKVDLDRVLKSQQDLYHSQVDQLRDVFINQCQLTGVNPLSQEMAAGALSVKLGKRPKNMLNPKAIKHLQMIFSIKDEVKTREGREIAALCKITVSQVRDYFANHRAKMRKIICTARKNAQKPEPSGGHNVQASLTTDQSVSEMAAVDTVVPSVPGENSGNNNNGELVQVSENTINSGTAQVGQQCSVDSTVIKTIEESPSCSTQEETVDGISSDDKKFVENIFNLMRKEETFSGQTKLMEWVLKIRDLSVLHWFVTKGGLPILATWLSEAAAEEQTTLLLVIFKVFEHLPLEKALPVQVKEILQTVNTLRFYRTSDVPNRAKALLLRWSKQFLRNHAEKKQSLKEAHQELMDIPEEILAIEGIRDMITQSEPMRVLKLLQPAGESSKISSGSGSSTKTTKSETKLRRKVKLVEQPDRRSPSKNAQIARAVPANQSRPMSADDIQKAKMHSLFMKNKYGKDAASPCELPKSKVPARKGPLPHSRMDVITEPARETTQITRRDERTTVARNEHIEAAEQTSQATKRDDGPEPAKETTQITRREKCITTRDEHTESVKETTQITRREKCITTRDEHTEPAKETTQITRMDKCITTRDECTESAKETTQISRDERMEPAKATTQITRRDECTTTTRDKCSTTTTDERMEATKQTSQATKGDEGLEPAKQTSQATRMDMHKEPAKDTSQTKRREERTEPVKETSQTTELRKNQFKWQIPPVMQIDSVWRIGTGENSKEVLVQNQRNRRAKEIFYATSRDVPPNPNDPWDMEMDYDDSLTPEIPIEPPHEADFIDVSHDNRVDSSLTPVPVAVPAPAPVPTVVPVMGAEPDMELLAVLLKNPELVFALTSEQGSSLISQETMALLDTLKNSGGAAGGSVIPSPSPSDASTANWSSQQTTRVMQAHFLAHPHPPVSMPPPPAPNSVFSSHQSTVTVNPASQLPSRPLISVQQKLTLPSSSNNPSHHQHLVQGPLPRASHPVLLPALTPTVLHPQLLAETAPSWPDHRDGAARGLYEAPAHNTYHPANQAEHSYYSRGHLHPGQAVERYSIPAGPFLETWSPERSSVRPQEFRTGPQRKDDAHRDRRPDLSRQWSNDRRDWNRDRDRSGERDRGRHWPNGSRWHDRERDRGRR